jgi:K+-transporting ATPase ATPase A chain
MTGNGLLQVALAHRAELPLRRDRHGHSGSADPGVCPALGGGHRQLLGGPDPEHALYLVAVVLDPGEGKEVRFGVANSTLWATATTAASNGSVNSMHDSYTPLGGLVPLWLIQLGEVVFDGVGSGLYRMIMFAIVAVFIAGLMIGRTPEYLGKKIESFEMKMATLTLLIPPIVILAFTALAVLLESGRASVFNPGPHGFSEVLYAFSSGTDNNGSAFAGLSANTPFYNITIGLAMLIGRFWLAVLVLAIAGSLAAKKLVPVGLGTLPTHTPLFVVLLIGTVLMVGALNFTRPWPWVQWWSI